MHVLGVAPIAKNSSFKLSTNDELVFEGEEELVRAGMYVREDESTGSGTTIIHVDAGVEEEGKSLGVGLHPRLACDGETEGHGMPWYLRN